MFLSVESSSTDQSYYSTMYRKANVSGEKVAYKIRKGDNLWNIAKKQLNKKNATNQEISEMMYSIAKLNNKETLESANNIKVNDIIYLPVAAGSRAAEKTSAQQKLSPEEQVKRTTAQLEKILLPPDKNASYSEKSVYKSKHREDVPDDLYAEHGKAGISYWTDLLKNPDNGVFIEKGYLGISANALHITKKEGDNRFGKTVAHLYVTMDANGKLKDVAFNSPGITINDIRFDYELDANGNLQKPDRFGARMLPLDKLPKEEYAQFLNSLQGYIDRELK